MQAERNKRVTKLYLRKLSRIWTVTGIFAILTGLLFLGAKKFPEEFFGFYRGFSRGALRVLAKGVSFVPFSIGEIFLFVLGLCLLTALIRLIYVMFSGRHRAMYLLTFASSLLLIVSILLFWFYSLWGMNYYAPELAGEMELSVKPRAAAELVALNKYLVAQANRYAELVPRDTNGDIIEWTPKALSKAVSEQFSGFSGASEPNSKYFLSSHGLSHLNISGIFLPFFGESCINKNNVPAELPFSMAHELAHRHAVAPENEANFLAFYSLYDSEDPYLAYSAYFGAIRYCQNMLYSQNQAAFEEVALGYGKLLSADLQSYRDYWGRFDGLASKISHQVNDKYLETHGQADGYASYDRMVDLMLAWFEKNPPN